MRISDWSSDVCSSDLDAERDGASEREMAEYVLNERTRTRRDWLATEHRSRLRRLLAKGHKLLSGGYLQILCPPPRRRRRSEGHTSELQSLLRISYAVFRRKTTQRDTCSSTDPT